MSRIRCLLAACICSLSVWSPVAAASRDAIKALEALSAALKEARAQGNDYHGNPMSLSTRPLVGLTRQEILLALGPPTHECRSNRDVAGCTQGGDLLYSFYTLPEKAVGGGPELTLRFNRRERCVRVVWGLSQ